MIGSILLNGTDPVVAIDIKKGKKGYQEKGLVMVCMCSTSKKPFLPFPPRPQCPLSIDKRYDVVIMTDLSKQAKSTWVVCPKLVTVALILTLFFPTLAFRSRGGSFPRPLV